MIQMQRKCKGGAGHHGEYEGHAVGFFVGFEAEVSGGAF